MLSSFPLLQLNLSHLHKYIPRAWKQRKTIVELALQTHHPLLQSLGERPSLEFNTEFDESIAHASLSSIKNFACQGDLYKAFKNYSLLRFHAFSSLSSSSSLLVLHAISALLLSCTTFKVLRQGVLLHAHIIVLGHEQNPVLVPKLVAVYSSCGHLNEAHFLTERSNVRNVVPWNVLISAYVKHGSYGEALSAYKQMVDMGVKPDNFTYPSVLKACSHECDLNFGREVHQSIDYKYLQWSLFVENALVSMYLKCGEFNVARSLFEKMTVRDVVSWNLMISGYGSKGMWDQANELFDRMWMENAQVNVVTWNIIARGCLQMANYKGVLALILQMRRRGVSLDSVTIVIGLVACSRAGFGRLGKAIHGSAVCGGYDGVECVKNAMVTMYSRCNDLGHAYELFRSMVTKSLVTWNSMIAGYAYLDRFEEASSIFREMLSFGFEPNNVTIASILPLCARMANLRHGRELHCYILRRRSFVDSLLLCNSLVDLYSKSGKMLEAHRVFDFMGEKDKVTYTSLIAGYGMQGEGQAALKLFEEMNLYRIKPDHITMVSVLSACSRSGLVSQGQMLFEMMISVYQINPQMEHFACMVDLFCRAGLLKLAVQIILEMPFQPSPAIWASLIGACRIKGNSTIGEWAADNLLKMKPEKLGFYVLIANMYSAAASWSKLENVRTLMKVSGMRNVPTCACTSVGYMA